MAKIMDEAHKFISGTRGRVQGGGENKSYNKIFASYVPNKENIMNVYHFKVNK